MLDIKFIKEYRDIVLDAIKNKKGEEVDLDKVLELHEKRKELGQELSKINEERNIAAKDRNIEEGKKLKEKAQKIEEEYGNVEREFVQLMIKLPNIPSPDTPIGDDESGNKVLRQWGDKPEFSFKPQAHWDLGKDLDLIDSERAAEVSGARFTYLKGDLVLLQFALVDLAFKTLTNEDTLKVIADEAGLDISTKPFVPVVPPVMMKSAVMNQMARLDPVDDRYFFEKDDLVFIGSAEHTMGPLHMGEVIDEKDLPIRYVGYSTSFRREAGSYGKDTRGILRQHQFDKVEMESFSIPETSLQEQDFLVAIQEYLLRKLEIPHQTIIVCTGDMGLPDTRQLDVETWMPGQDAYRETHSADHMGSYQARRLGTRVRRDENKREFVHMNDATVFAIGRMLIAIMENNQQEDGSIKIPKVLQSYLGKEVIGK